MVTLICTTHFPIIIYKLIHLMILYSLLCCRNIKHSCPMWSRSDYNTKQLCLTCRKPAYKLNVSWSNQIVSSHTLSHKWYQNSPTCKLVYPTILTSSCTVIKYWHCYTIQYAILIWLHLVPLISCHPLV